MSKYVLYNNVGVLGWTGLDWTGLDSLLWWSIQSTPTYIMNTSTNQVLARRSHQSWVVGGGVLGLSVRENGGLPTVISDCITESTDRLLGGSPRKEGSQEGSHAQARSRHRSRGRSGSRRARSQDHRGK